LLVDGASIGLFIAGAAGDASPLVGLGAAGYFLGSPIVHFAHGRPGAAVGSLGLHLGLPVIGAGIGLAAADCHNDHEEGWCGVGEMGIGLLLGIVGATVLDTTLLAHERADENDAPVGAINLSPVIDPHRRMAAVTVSGGF
jgi:hypothetical protein